MKNYFIPNINDFKTKIGEHNFNNKIILEIGSDMELCVAQEFIKQGAKKVICVNPKFPDKLISPNEKIVLIKDFGENTHLASNSFDYIFGIALIEHVINLSELMQEVKRLLKIDGCAFLQGNPIYTSPNGHHLWVKTDTTHYTFYNENNPFRPWEHLSLKTESELIKNLEQKHIKKEHLPFLVNYLLSNDTSKYSTSQIISSIKQVCKNNVIIYEKQTKVNKNKYYYEALKFYNDKDLKTEGLTFLYASKLSRLKIFYKKIKKLFLHIRITNF